MTDREALPGIPKLIRVDVRPARLVRTITNTFNSSLACPECMPHEHYVKPIGWARHPDGEPRVVCLLWYLCLN